LERKLSDKRDFAPKKYFFTMKRFLFLKKGLWKRTFGPRGDTYGFSFYPLPLSYFFGCEATFFFKERGSRVLFNKI